MRERYIMRVSKKRSTIKVGLGTRYPHTAVASSAKFFLWRIIRRKSIIVDRMCPQVVATKAGYWLSLRLSALRVARPDAYTLHSIRRGAAQTFIQKGGGKAALCKAGSWSSDKAAKVYLDATCIGSLAAAAALADE